MDTLCEDCSLNDCDSCYEADCACNQAAHTLAPAILIKSALMIVNPDRPVDIEVIFPTHCDKASAEFQVEINGRIYKVTVTE